MKTLLFIIVTLFACSTFAQITTTTPPSKRKQYPHFSFSPEGGAIFPLPKTLNRDFKPGALVGFDISYRVNQEVAIFMNGKYAFMGSKLTGAPVGSYLIGNVGPRYYFTTKKLQSAFFLEGSVGIYNFRQTSFNVTTADTSYTVNQISNSKAGLSGGLGGSLSLSKQMDILVKSDYHVVFTENGSSNFITILGGLEFRFK